MKKGNEATFEQHCFLRMLRAMEPSKTQLNLDLDKSRLEKLMENTYLLRKAHQPQIHKRSKLSWHLHDEPSKTRPSKGLKRSNSADASKKTVTPITCDVANLNAADFAKLEVVGTNPISRKASEECAVSKQHPVIKRSIMSQKKTVTPEEGKAKCKIVRSRQILRELQRQVIVLPLRRGAQFQSFCNFPAETK